MVNITEVQRPADEGWVIGVVPNTGHPVTNWLVVGPYYNSGLVTDGQGVAESMFNDKGEALTYARQAVEELLYHVKVVVYPPDPIG